MAAEAVDPPAETPGVPASVRAQLLATEHWSLLASRSTTQSEVLTRISMFLTLTSASLLSIALVGQATSFSDTFRMFAVAVLGILMIVGALTQVRVYNVSLEDLRYVLAMNRLRAAYVEIDPGITPYLMASRFDDRPGAMTTYYWLGRRSDLSQVAGSSMIFIGAVTSALAGLFSAAIAGLFGAPPPILYATGFAVGAVYLVLSSWSNARSYIRLWKTYEPYAPSSAGRPIRPDADPA